MDETGPQLFTLDALGSLIPEDYGATGKGLYAVELANALNIGLLKERHKATAFAVISAAGLAFCNGSGKGAMKLWPLFGSINQLLAGLALLVITIYLARRGARIIYTAIPMIFMIIMTGWSILIKISFSFRSQNWLLFGIGLLVFMLELWMIAESAIILFHKKGTGIQP